MTTPTDLTKVADEWLNECGPHDYGVASASCACPPDNTDPRPDILRLVSEVERCRAALKAAGLLHLGADGKLYGPAHCPLLMKTLAESGDLCSGECLCGGAR